jgi:Tol biopolymer transport system component/C-terminal processing protease CtpA/Prc
MQVRPAFALISLFAFLFTTLPSAAPAAEAPAPLPSFAEPSISPDHREIAFVSGGDIWSVPAGGGAAHLLAAVDGTASRPLYSPDGKRLAFVSSRPGAYGIYLLTIAGGTLTRLTHNDALPELDGWSPDGGSIYFATNENNIAYFGDVMRVAADGGTPVRAIGERFVNAMEAAPSPDGRTIAFVRNGFVQWWRRGHSHIDQDEIVLDRLDAHRFDTVTDGASKDRWPMWSPDGRTLYYVSDRSGSDELWANTGGGARQVSALHGESVLWPTISRDGKLIAFEHAMAIWTYDPASGTTRRLAIDLRGLPDVTTPRFGMQLSGFSGLGLSPDAKKIAFVARGQIFAASAQDGSDAEPVPSTTIAADHLPVWNADSRHIAYVVDRGTEQAIATYAFPDGPERILTPPGHHDDYPHWSPDGRTLAFVRDGVELHLLDLVSGTDRIAARGLLDRRPFGDEGNIAFSPAGDWIAYVDQDRGGFSNVRVVPTAGGASRPVTFLPNTSGGPVAWSPDGTRLYFVTSQRTEAADVAQVDLVPRAPRFREDAFRQLFDQEPSRPELRPRTTPTAPPTPAARASRRPRPEASTPPAPQRTQIEFSGIRDRVSMLATGLDVATVAVTPDSKALILVANAAAEQNLYAFSVDDTSSGPAVARQLTNTLGPKEGLTIAPDGKSVYYLDSGHVSMIALDTRDTAQLPVSAELTVDFSRTRDLIFRQAWSMLDRWYANPKFNGVDWNAVFRTYEPHAVAARTPAEFRRVMELMLGELDSSHMGISAEAAFSPAPSYTIGRLGAQWDAQTYERTGRVRIAEIVPLGPLALAGGVAVGDELLAVDGSPVDRHSDVDMLLANRIGKRTVLRIAPHGNANAARTVVVRPVDLPTEQGLLYRAWVDSRRAYVDKRSGGRLGYVHLLDMSDDALRKFELNLDVQNRAKEGVVVDVRNNEGGFVDPYATDVLTRPEYERFVSRFGADAPPRTSLGQRVLDKPTVLVVNEHSLSDSENFAEGYRRLHAGPIVGEPTAGWIIFTSAATLADGSTLRLPTTSVFTLDGVNMERHPRPVDVQVDDPPGAAARGDDPQLDAAVSTLLRRVAAQR